MASGAAACAGASCVDRFGRRKMLLACCLALALLWGGMLGGTGAYATLGSTASAHASIAFIFRIAMVFSAVYTPFQALYPVEVLSFEQRARGMALQNMAGNAASLVNQFALPIALETISWKTYFVYLGTCSAMAVYYSFVMVETRGHTLEELNDIFQAKNPVKASLAARKDLDTVVAEVKDIKGDV